MTSERILHLSTLMIDWLKSKSVNATLNDARVIPDPTHEYMLYIDNKLVGWIDDDAVTFTCCHSPEGHICGGRWHAADPEFFDKVWSHLKQRNVRTSSTPACQAL